MPKKKSDQKNPDTKVSKKRENTWNPARTVTITALGKTKSLKRSYHGEDLTLRFDPPVKEDLEKTLPSPEDAASKLKFPPPKKHPTFRKIWMQFIDGLAARDNFNIGHLNNLEILCDLYVEYEELQEVLRTKGRSYLSIGRGGEVWKLYPEVGQLTRVQTQIKSYCSMLKLNPKMDHGTESGGEKNEWD